MDTENTIPDLRYPEGAALVWTATEPGFYVCFQPGRIRDKSGFVLAVGKLCVLDDYNWPPDRRGGVSANFMATSNWSEKALLGPYDTPEEARAALKFYALAVIVDYPLAVFEEPDGRTIPLSEWRGLP